MSLKTVLRLNMTGLQSNPKDEAKRYQAALDMAAYAEQKGFSVVSVEEHHCAENGWLSSPLTLASMIVARTSTISVNVTALLVTLYDPVRLAEDIAVLDLVSNGRFNFVAGLGYRPLEYHAMDKDWQRRGALMDHVISTLLKAWSGEPFDYKGQTIRVTPVPMSRPHPFFFIGGTSKAAADRAAKFGLPFYPPMPIPELESYYQQALERYGTRGFVFYPDKENSMITIDDNPEQAWQELGPYFMREAQEYSSWKHAHSKRPSDQHVTTIDELRALKRYEILTPQQCIERIAQDGGHHTVVLHPLAGGVPPVRAWRGLEMYVDKVLPHFA